MSIFTIGSLLCAVAPSINALIAFRVIQGLGAAILVPLALATTAMIFPPKQRGLGLALLAVVANTAAAIGPPVGGLLVEYANWHWIFLVNVPIGVLGVLLALRVMPESFDLTSNQQVDWYGMALLGGSIFCLTYALVEANRHGWGSLGIVSLLAGAAVLGVAFAISQRLGRWPMLAPSLLRNRQFVGASGAMTLFAVAVMGPLFLAVIAFVNMWGYSQLKAALAVSPIALVGMIVSPIVGRNADRVPPRLMAVPAMLVMAAGLIWLGEMPARPDYVKVLPALALMGAGMGAIFPSVNVGGMGSISGQELGLGSGIVNMSRQLGFAIGVAVLVAVFTGVLNDRAPAARAKAEVALEHAGYSPQRREALLKRVFFSRSEEASKRKPPRNAVERQVAGLAAGVARDGFGAGFRVAALFLLLAVPFALVMRRPPAAAHAAAAAAAG
jgi:EmrB/QacA subfamily drug resistance transporter